MTLGTLRERKKKGIYNYINSLQRKETSKRESKSYLYFPLSIFHSTLTRCIKRKFDEKCLK